jgi:signal transduction histidine kinase
VGEILHIPVEQALSERVRWLVKLRWLALGIGVLVTLVGDWWLGQVLPMLPLAICFAILAFYNLAFWIVASRLVSKEAPLTVQTILLHGQILCDLVLLTAILHFSGGLENPFSILYVLIVVVGSILIANRVSYLYATVATGLWAGLLFLEGVGIIPHYNLTGFRLPFRYQEPWHIVAESVTLGMTNFGVAYLSSNIARRLREGERELYEANASCELRAAELARLNRRLRELDQDRSMFIRLVTHELRAPVAAIQSYLRLILDGYVPEERMNEIVAKAEARAKDQLDLIGDLLDLARLQEPRRQSEFTPCDAAALMNDIVDMLRTRAEDKDQTLIIDVQEDIPPVLASEEHIRQVWINLVSNAIKYTPEGGQITIHLGCKSDSGGEVRVCGHVQDTGIGINPDEQKHIFESFYRTESAKSMAAHGTGLGLSIVSGIMERYGGHIWLESEPNVGTTFFFELPCADEALQARPPSDEKTPIDKNAARPTPSSPSP